MASWTWRFALAAVAALHLAAAQTNPGDVAALASLQQCISQHAGSFAFINGWNLSGGATQTANAAPGAEEVTAQLAALGVPGLESPPPATAGASGGSDPCGNAANPVPWTGLLCEGGRVTQLLISQLATTRNLPCDVASFASLSSLSAVERVDFTNAGLTGSLPPQWAEGFDSLVSLTLAQNDIEGTLPAEWASGLANLDTLNLAQNRIGGSLPPEWGTSSAFPALINLVLGNNELSGQLPPWEGGFPAAQLFGFSNNSLEGVLPDVWAFPALSTLELYGNEFTGCLPGTWPQNLPNLTSLTVQDNQLFGQFPTTYDGWGSLTTITITPGNTFCGAVSPALAATPDGEGRRFNPEPTEPNSEQGFDLGTCPDVECPAYAYVPGPTPADESSAASPTVSSAGRRLLL